MKKLFTLVLAFLATGAVMAQTKSTAVNFAIPNAGMENWYTIPVVNYEDLGTGPTDNWLGTLNSLYALPQSAGGPGPLTIFKTTDAHSGTYAAKAVSNIFPLGPTTIFIPGMIGTAIMDNVNVRALIGRPCPDCKPTHLKGYFKFEPVNNDSCAVVLLCSRWNSTAKKRDTVGYGKFVQHTAVNSYTQFEVPVNYTGSGTVDSISLLIVSSAGFNVVNFLGSVGQVGNTMYVDDLVLDYPSGVQQVLMPEVNMKIYPNPASDVLHISLSKALRNASVEIYNVSMERIGTYSVTGSATNVGVGSLPAGSYYFRLMSGSDMMNTGSFVIAR